MGRAIIGGVVTSTALTLVVVPVLYSYLDAWAERRRARHALHVVKDGANAAGAAHAAPAEPAAAE
jgi:HAE1 family hydrophobic/amphiphilic exporter-1